MSECSEQLGKEIFENKMLHGYSIWSNDLQRDDTAKCFNKGFLERGGLRVPAFVEV